MKAEKPVVLDGTLISSNHPPYIVAELSANHNGNINVACEMIKEAKRAGANAVKLQTYRADTITLKSSREEFKIKKGKHAGKTLYELYDQAHTPWEWHEKLFNYASEIGITIFSSPFDHEAIDYLENLNCCAYKIASCELIDLPLIKKAASTGKPIILSTGMADINEINEAIYVVNETGNENLIVLHCVSGYPTPIEDSNLMTIQDLGQRLHCPIGLSDHTKTIDTSIIGITYGACFIEKHFVLDNDNIAIDEAFSLSASQFKELTNRCNQAWKARGKVDFGIKASEEYTKRLRRSLYVVNNIKKGQKINASDIRSVRPNNGLLPKYYEEVLGMKAKKDIESGTPLSWDLIDDL